MKYKAVILSALALLAWVGILAAASWWQDQQVVYPLSRHFLRDHRVLGDYTYESSSSAQSQPGYNGIVYGFLPYWSVDDYQISDAVTHVSYFRLAVDPDGHITDDVGQSIYQSQRIQQLFSQVTRQNLALEVTFFTSHSDDIYDLVTCEQCLQTFRAEILDVVRDDRLDGVNLDLEYLGTLTPEEQQNVTMFLYELKNDLLEQFPRTKLSIDVYGGAANMTSNLYDFAKISQIVDHVIIMGYDYKTRRADIPGSTAPTLGENLWGGGIWDDVISMIRFVPAENIILAIPFYGYAWETTACELDTARTYPDTGETLTYRGAQNILESNEYDATEYWDENSLTPYLVFTQNDLDADGNVIESDEEKRCHIGFFENTRSVGYKIDLVENLHLGGIAIWALGFEGDHDELWDTIRARFNY